MTKAKRFLSVVPLLIFMLTHLMPTQDALAYSEDWAEDHSSSSYEASADQAISAEQAKESHIEDMNALYNWTPPQEPVAVAAATEPETSGAAPTETPVETPSVPIEPATPDVNTDQNNSVAPQTMSPDLQSEMTATSNSAKPSEDELAGPLPDKGRPVDEELLGQVDQLLNDWLFFGNEDSHAALEEILVEPPSQDLPLMDPPEPDPLGPVIDWEPPIEPTPDPVPTDQPQPSPDPAPIDQPQPSPDPANDPYNPPADTNTPADNTIDTTIPPTETQTTEPAPGTPEEYEQYPEISGYDPNAEQNAQNEECTIDYLNNLMFDAFWNGDPTAQQELDSLIQPQPEPDPNEVTNLPGDDNFISPDDNQQPDLVDEIGEIMTGIDAGNGTDASGIEDGYYNGAV